MSDKKLVDVVDPTGIVAQIVSDEHDYRMPVLPLLETWVNAFVEWMKDYRPHLPSPPHDPFLVRSYMYFVRELSRSRAGGAWVQYDGKGIYKEYDQYKLQAEIYKWLQYNHLKLNKKNVNEALERLKTVTIKAIEDFDVRSKFDPIWNNISGYWHPVTGVLEPHTPDYLSLSKCDCMLVMDPPTDDADRLRKVDGLEKMMPSWQSMKAYYPVQMDKIERFLQAIIRNDVWIKLGMFIVGSSNTGKTTVVNIINEIFKKVASYQSLNKIGGQWGLMPLIGKKVNIDTDSSPSMYDNTVCEVYKSITGDPDTELSTDIIYAGQRNILFDTFFITVSNQLSKLPPEVDRNAFFKRVLLVEMNHVFDDDPLFEQAILSEVDTIFTYLCYKEYHPLTRANFKQYVKDVRERWDYWSNPIQRIILDTYRRSTDITALIPQQDVQEEIYSVVLDMGLITDKTTNRVIQHTLERMGIGLQRKQVKGIQQKAFIGIKKKNIDQREYAIKKTLMQWVDKGNVDGKKQQKIEEKEKDGHKKSD